MKKWIQFTAVSLVFSTGLMAQSPRVGKPASASLDQRVRAIEDRDAILKTIHQYAYTVDFGHDVHEYTDLYTEDAVFQANAPLELTGPASALKGAVIGREGLEKWIINEWQMRERLAATGHYRIHETIGSDITLDGDKATARSYFQTTDNDNGRIFIVSIGLYKDELVRSPDGRWRMKQRLLVRQGGVANNGAGRAGAQPAAPAQR